MSMKLACLYLLVCIIGKDLTPHFVRMTFLKFSIEDGVNRTFVNVY